MTQFWCRIVIRNNNVPHFFFGGGGGGGEGLSHLRRCAVLRRQCLPLSEAIRWLTCDVIGVPGFGGVGGNCGVLLPITLFSWLSSFAMALARLVCMYWISVVPRLAGHRLLRKEQTSACLYGFVSTRVFHRLRVLGSTLRLTQHLSAASNCSCGAVIPPSNFRHSTISTSLRRNNDPLDSPHHDTGVIVQDPLWFHYHKLPRIWLVGPFVGPSVSSRCFFHRGAVSYRLSRGTGAEPLGRVGCSVVMPPSSTFSATCCPQKRMVRIVIGDPFDDMPDQYGDHYGQHKASILRP